MHGSMRRKCAALCVLLCFGLVSTCQASGDALTRQVQWGKHLVETRATLEDPLVKEGAHGRRALSSSTHSAPVMFLLGYEPSIKATVTSALTSMGASIVQSLPSNHWLVGSTPANVHSLQQQFPSMTSSVLPKQAKISDSAERIVREIRQASHVHSKAQPGRVLHGASGVKSSEPAWLKELKHYKSEDGHTHIVLSVDRPAFTTVKNAYCSECPERAQAKREAEAWATGMKEGLAAALSQMPGDACHPIIESYTLIGTLRLVVCLEQAEGALSWLTEQGEVVSVGFEHVLRPLDLHATHAFQTGAFSSPLPDNFSSDGVRENLFPYWAAGITGEGQLVGIGDSGIDMGSCYMYDPAYADYQNNTANIKTTEDFDGVSFEHFANANHRKVTSYYWFRDTAQKDDEVGHGTHVAGIVAGSPYNFDPIANPDLATGVAPRARITFFDAQNSDSEAMTFPGDCAVSNGDNCTSFAKGTDTSLFELQHKEGARISSNSWGKAEYYYSSTCRDFDGFVWANDMLILVAAGNDATNPDTPPVGPTGKVGSPATCKNVLAIGATQNFYNVTRMPGEGDGTGDRLIDDNGDQIQVTNVAEKFKTNEALAFYKLDSEGFRENIQLTLTQGYTYFPWNDQITIGAGLEAEVVLADPLHACTNLTGDYTNKVIMFALEGTVGCSPIAKAENVMATGAVGGIMASSPADGNVGATEVTGLPFITSAADPDGISIYKIAVGLSNGERYVFKTRGNSPYDYVTSFSSYGNRSEDSYILPKLMAPGALLSAGTDGSYDAGQSSCKPQVALKKGTSMAAPAAAGAAVLARQYFMDGFYPTGSKVPENTMEPTASLLTAVLVAGASAMQGFSISDGVPLQMYDEHEGYGRVNLFRSLPLDGVTPSGWNMQVWQKQSFSAAGETKRYKVASTASASLSLALAWMDLPSTSTGGVPALINDIDLKVTAPDGSVLWGNDRTDGDRANNIEKVVIDSPQSGEYSVEVTSVSINTVEGPQSFSVVTLGGIDPAATEKVGPPPPPSPLPSAVSPSESDEEFDDNERQADIAFGIELTADQLDDLRDETSSLYRTFREETTSFFAKELGEGSQVTLTSLILPSNTNRRSLLQTVDVTGRYLFKTPDGTSAEETQRRTDSVIARLNEDDGAQYLASNTNLGSLMNIQSISAVDTTPNTAQRAGTAVLHVLAALGAVLLLML